MAYGSIYVCLFDSDFNKGFNQGYSPSMKQFLNIIDLYDSLQLKYALMETGVQYQ